MFSTKSNTFDQNEKSTRALAYLKTPFRDLVCQKKTSRRASRYVRPAFRSSELRSDLEVSIRKSAFPIQTDKMLFWRTSSSPSTASSGNGVNSDLKRRKDFPRCPRDRTKIVRVIQGQLLSQQLSASCQIHKK